MANNKNMLLKKAFEEAAKQEIIQSLNDNKIVVPFSDRHNSRMRKLFNNKNTGKTENVKNFSVRRAFVSVAAAIALLIAVTVTAGASILNLFDIAKFDNDNYTAVQWVIDKATVTGEGNDEFFEIEYTGKPINISYSLATGKNSTMPERSLVVLVNGVRQTFDAVVGDKKYENIDILPLEIGLGTVQTAELSFVPDTGKKGDVLALEVAAIYDPDADFYPDCIGDGAHSDNDVDYVCDSCGINIRELPAGPSSLTLQNEAFARLIMKKNAKNVSDNICESFSGYVESELDKIIYACHDYWTIASDEKFNEYDSLESLCAIFYKDIDESLFYDENGLLSLQTKFITTAKQKDEYTINLHGKSGEYRVAFYIGTQPQPVFDEKEYVDIEIKEGKQVELNIAIDTTKLTGENNFSVVYKHIGENLFEDYWWFTQQTCEGTIAVEK